MTRFTSRFAIVAVAAIALAGVVTAPLPASAAGIFGSHIGETLDQCDDNLVPHGDDSVSPVVQLGWTLRLDGLKFTTLRVDTNGKVWLGSNPPANSEATRTPDFTSFAYPTIAPFGSDVSTDAAGAGDVTYGVGADGTFCAVWNQVGYFSGGKTHTDKLNTFQLILRPAENLGGRTLGDVDITFNYDLIEWDRDGHATAGYTSGNTAQSVKLEGSHTDGTGAGDFLEYGNHDLAWSNSGSAHSGRYIYSVTNLITSVSPGNLIVHDPEVSGSNTVGSTLTARVTAWGPAPVEMVYVWARDGMDPIPGDYTKLTDYTLTPEDVGHTIQLVVIGFKTNYAQQYRGSNAVTVVAAPAPATVTPPAVTPAPAVAPATAPATVAPLTAGQPKIAGTAKVGKKLTVKVGAWTPGTMLSYQWYANGKAIKKATKATLKVAASVRGKKITVKVTGSKTGYLPVVRSTTATRKVAK